MGNFASKPSEECPKLKTETPKRPKVLPFDPRSPSENFSRTPITVTHSSDNITNGTPLNDKVKVLKFDPRSPSVEISRTPIEVESKLKNRHLPLKPTKLSTIATDLVSELQECDPRSPTEKVPRTPLESNGYEIIPTSISQKLENGNSHKENVDEVKTNGSVNENNSSKVITKSSDSQSLQTRVPLADIQNVATREASTKTNNKQIELEEEYSKTQEILLSQIPTPDSKISTVTQFIEDI